ncbi:MAG: aldo/keto reductase [Mycobacteriales bacterium]
MTATDPHVPDRTLDLPSGAALPLLGFGTWQLHGKQARAATEHALRVGYRHLDTATMYGNEAEVGQALVTSGVDRADVFVTTKLPPDHAGRGSATLQESLRLLAIDAVDLWLLHWPPAPDLIVSTWRELIDARDAGLARDIGVSNFSLSQIDEIMEVTGVAPAVNQISWSPLLFDRAVLDGHTSRGVVLEGYSALRNGALEHPVVVDIADRIRQTPAQVILRWHLHHDTVVIPKSADPGRIAANADLDFALSPADLSALNALSAC